MGGNRSAAITYIRAGAVSILMLACQTTRADDLADAVEDRQQFAETEWPHLYYFSLASVPGDLRDELRTALMFACASTSSEQVIERQLPIPVTETLFRLDIRGAGWDGRLASVLVAEYPYRLAPSKAPPLVIRADWFVQAALDQTQSDLYFTLLFGDVPESEVAFLKLLETSDKRTFRYGQIEERSGVSVAGIRTVESWPTSRRVDTWITRDSAEITLESDPLQFLDGSAKYDASEIIGGLPKVSITTGKRGFMQVYALTNADGEIQKKAPTDIVVDHQKMRGVEIRNPISCVGCHAKGLNPPVSNGFADFIRSGAEAYAIDYEAIEAFHLGGLETLIERHNEDYQAIVLAVTGVDAEVASGAVYSIVQHYDGAVTTEQAAIETGTTPDELKLAIAYASNGNKELPARVVALAHDRAMPRTLWEQVYPTVKGIVETWHSRN